MELGLSNYFIHLIFPIKYYNAIPQFNIMIISLPFFAFIIFHSVMLALGKLKIIIANIAIALILSFLILYLIGLSGNPVLVSFGIVTYNIVWGLLNLLFVTKYLDFKLTTLLSGIADIKNFFIKRLRNI